MKKLIALIGAVNLSASVILPVTSCSVVDNKKNSDNQSTNENNQLTDEAKTQVQELNIISMLEEGIDADGILTTNSTIAEAVEMLNEKAQNINEDIIISSQNEENDAEKKLIKGNNNIKVIVKNIKDEHDEKKVTAKIKNTREVEIDNAHFSGILDELFNKTLDGKDFSVLNTYDDALGLVEEQIIQVENSINIELVNKNEIDTKLTSTENKINIRFSDDKNSVDKEVTIMNVKTENFFAKTKDAIKKGAMEIKTWGYSVEERTKNAFSKIKSSIIGVGGKIKDSAENFKTKIANAFKSKKQEITIEVEINGSTENVTISVNENKDGADEITKKLIVYMLNTYTLNTESLTTNDKLGSIIPIVQSHISGVKSAHEYSLFINPKDKIGKFKTSNKIKITFKKRKETNVSFSHTINVGIKNTSSKINLDFLPKHIDASKFGFTTETKWSSILKYIQTSLDTSTAKNYTIKIVDKNNSQKLKTTDKQFSVLITSKKSKSDKTNFKIMISNIKTGTKKVQKKRLKAFETKLLVKINHQNLLKQQVQQKRKNNRNLVDYNNLINLRKKVGKIFYTNFFGFLLSYY